MLIDDRSKLLRGFAEQSDKLLVRGIIRSDSFTGEIGEYVACQHFGLHKVARSTKSIDAIDKIGRTYQVKAKVVSGGRFTYDLQSIDFRLFDFLVIVYFDSLYSPLQMVRIHSNPPADGSSSDVSPASLSNLNCDIIDGSQLRIPQEDTIEIRKFGELFKQIQSSGIVRSRRIVGDIGEFYACQYLNLTLADNLNQKGVDAIDKSGIKYEIKTRRVYESDRRTSKTRRLNNLIGKSAEFLIVVALDWSFQCAGVWLLPMRSIHNPKSAHLGIVRTTPGTRVIVETTIDWLRSPSGREV